MFGGVTLISIFIYWTSGRHVYEGPAVLVEGRRKAEQAGERRWS